MTHRSIPVNAPVQRAPFITKLLNPFAKVMLKAGIPLGTNVLVTMPGRVSGKPRTTPLAVIEADGRRWLWSPWGDVQWVKNLRAAGGATITARRQSEEVIAIELDPEERMIFFRDVLAPFARDLRGGMTFVRLIDGVDLNHPVEEAEGRPVFELGRAG
jgi:deazaflavin-dependent oxidoreductase (nitroreductase family)